MKILKFDENPVKAAEKYPEDKLYEGLSDVIKIMKGAVYRVWGYIPDWREFSNSQCSEWCSYSQANFRWCLGLASTLILRIKELHGVHHPEHEEIRSLLGHHSRFSRCEFTPPPIS